MECSRCEYLKTCRHQCMRLPEGKTCADCVNMEWCKIAYGAKPQNASCDFEPIRFKAKKEEAGNEG